MNLLEKLRMFNRELVKENARLSKIYDNMCESAKEAGEDLEEVDRGLNETLADSLTSSSAGIGAAVGGLAGAAYGKMKKGGSWKDAALYGLGGAAAGAGVGAGIDAMSNKTPAAKTPTETSMPTDNDWEHLEGADVHSSNAMSNKTPAAKTPTETSMPTNNDWEHLEGADVHSSNATPTKTPVVQSGVVPGTEGQPYENIANGGGTGANESDESDELNEFDQSGLQDFQSFVKNAQSMQQNESEYSKYNDDRDPDTGYIGPIQMSGEELFSEGEGEDTGTNDQQHEQPAEKPEMSDEEFFSPALEEGGHDDDINNQIDKFFAESTMTEDDILMSRPTNADGIHNGHIDEGQSIPAGKFFGLVNEGEEEMQEASQFFAENDDEAESLEEDEDTNIPPEQFLMPEREQEIDELDKGEMMDYEEFYNTGSDSDTVKECSTNESLRTFKHRR